MNIIFSTGCLYQNSLSYIFEIAQIAGFDGIEYLIDENKCNISAENIFALSRKFDMKILSIHSPFVACDGWGNFWERIDKAINLAKMLSVQLVTFHPPRGVITFHNLHGKLREHIKGYKKNATDSDIMLNIENLPCPRRLRKIPLLRRMIPSFADNTIQIAKFAKENNINVTLDTTHIGTTGQDILSLYKIFKKEISNIHLSDYDGMEQHLLPGRGKLPLKEFLLLLKKDGYNGLITLETQPSAMEHKDMNKVIQNAKYCLSYTKDILS